MLGSIYSEYSFSAVSCGVLPAVENAEILFDSPTYNIATYQCIAGHYFMQRETNKIPLTCQPVNDTVPSLGQWDQIVNDTCQGKHNDNNTRAPVI